MNSFFVIVQAFPATDASDLYNLRIDEDRRIMQPKVIARILGILLMTAGLAQAGEIRATIVYDDVATQLSSADPQPAQLWITTGDLTRSTRFEVKPQGVCRKELCFPIPKARKQEFLHDSAGKQWFNLLAFADLVHQPVAHDEALATWYFGLRSDQRQTLASLEAPNFTLPDMEGKLHSLSDFRGKKVFLVTWASW